MDDEAPKRIGDLRTMQEGFTLLRSYPMIGNFLAYQFVTDLNYSSLTNFSEMEFVIPGPGALDGLNQQKLQEQFGIVPVQLCGRPLQLIDCQNLFCETDKYARVAYPEIAGFSGRTRIKQSFRMTGPITDPVFPKKWNLDFSLLERLA